MNKQTLYLTLTLGVLLSACTKDIFHPQVPDHGGTKTVTISFKEVETSKTYMEFSNDSLLVTVPRNVDITSLTPVLNYRGTIVNGATTDFTTVQAFVVNHKTVYVSVKRRDAIFIGGYTKMLALDSRDGSLLWKDSTNENFTYSNPLLVGDTLYAGNTAGYMCAFNARTGQSIWRKFLSPIGIESPATVNGNTLYVGHNDDYLVALNRATGDLKWQFQTGGNISTKPVIYQNKVIFGSSDGYVYALDTAHGTPVWQSYSGGFIVSSSPALSNGVVFIGTRSNEVVAMNAATGARKWAYNTGVSMEHANPVVANGTVYAAGWYNVPEFNIRGSLYALDEQTGSLKWQSLDSIGLGGALTWANGLLYLPADDANFYAVNATTGAVVWSRQILPNGAGAAVKNGVVYVGGGGSGYVYAIDAFTGMDYWTYAIPGEYVTSDPAVGRKKGKGISISTN